MPSHKLKTEASSAFAHIPNKKGEAQGLSPYAPAFIVMVNRALAMLPFLPTTGKIVIVIRENKIETDNIVQNTKVSCSHHPIPRMCITRYYLIFPLKLFSANEAVLYRKTPLAAEL
ncbi:MULTISPECIES: hypothetical protein [unclassified Mesobacillus]|uniref:hypothetical protein n=1 Tax=unclassified Mesobacillus TaxID=2675270 RepID=UPI00203EB82A|nr:MULTISPECIES: hypothetical protein [unclassified Mesobacillus]MCM3124368.1 hypothetical protein [Mesobacillus sp. MER 33]MCM3234922.1 hypothetical protein [Mesobacillus sp. MER 48]